jgi:peptide/nickel transport system substrate-binding protein
VPTLLLLVVGALWLLRPSRPGAASAPARVGGRLRATLRVEPRTFNRIVARDRGSLIAGRLLHAPLVRVNPISQALEPALAESWTSTPDGRAWTIQLRRGVRFSDGVPLTANDVVFSLGAVYDASVRSPLVDTLSVNGVPLRAHARDDHTVVITSATPLGAGLRPLDALPIVPRRVLGAALAAGRFREAWSVTTPPGQIVGAGPFVLREHRAGERLVFARNTHYWATDDRGSRLPYLDEIIVSIVPDQNAEMLRLTGGETDLVAGSLRPEDVVEARKRAESGRLEVHDAGVSLDADFLWFNLRPGANRDRPWLQRLELRDAVSLAVDRRAFVDAVYMGLGEPIQGPITPGNTEWFARGLPAPVHDPPGAAARLRAIGLVDRDGDGMRETPGGRPARFTLLTQKGNTLRERSAAVIQQDLESIGLAVDVAMLDQPAIVDRLMRGEFDAIYLGLESSDADPTANLGFWLSSGAFHAWYPQQARPGTAWEARIDDLMTRQAATTDQKQRRHLVGEAQHVFVDHKPALFFAAPRVLVATSPRVRGVRPGALHPSLLWQADRIQLAER